MDKITSEHFASWRQNPITVAFYAHLDEQIEVLVGLLKNGRTLKDTAENTHKETAKIVGMIIMCENIQGISAQSLRDDNEE